MQHSFSNVFVHVVFSTRNRIPCIDLDVRPVLHAYIAGVVRQTGCRCYRVGGTADHVHLAIQMDRSCALSQVVREAKSRSSHWLHSNGADWMEFAWQRGYGAFSVEARNLKALCDYIQTQELHHADQSFDQEFRRLLTKNSQDTQLTASS
jgi:putative transposase